MFRVKLNHHDCDPPGDLDLIRAMCDDPTSTADELARLIGVCLPDAATDDDPGEDAR